MLLQAPLLLGSFDLAQDDLDELFDSAISCRSCLDFIQRTDEFPGHLRLAVVAIPTTRKL